MQSCFFNLYTLNLEPSFKFFAKLIYTLTSYIKNVHVAVYVSPLFLLYIKDHFAYIYVVEACFHFGSNVSSKASSIISLDKQKKQRPS